MKDIKYSTKINKIFYQLQKLYPSTNLQPNKQTDI